MVQDRVSAYADHPFLHGFATSVPLLSDHELTLAPSHLVLALSLDGGAQVFEHGRGLTEGRSHDDKLVAVFAVHEPEQLGIGEHPFVLTVTGDGGEIYREEGTLVVAASEDAPTDVSPTGVVLWFDAFQPFTPAADGDRNPLPDPEVPAEVQNERFSICQLCPELDKESGECHQCGCFMPYKSGLAAAECPIGKWSTWGLNVIQ